MNRVLRNLMVKKEMAKIRLADFGKKLMSEEGDTNFISIIIILGIVIILVGVFIVFKDRIIGTISDIINGFSKDSLGTDKDSVLIKPFLF